MELRIDQQFARIGLNITEPFLSLKTTLPKIELKTEKPEIRIQAPLPQVFIDQSECFADMNKRRPLEFAWHMAGLAREQVLQAIDGIVAEGNMLAAIEKGTTIADLAEMKGQNEIDYNVACVPQHRPKIDVEIQPVEVQLIRGEIELKLYRGQVHTWLSQGKVEVYMQKKPEIKIEWIGNVYDQVI
ncbi:MAG: hypothetical protein H5T98_04690 [Syntrophomonadaceae bacterium]|nr:hypothetical protein [Syntrophomonadaceae bacterium]